MPEYQRSHLVLSERETSDPKRMALWTREIADFIAQQVEATRQKILTDKRFKDERNAKGLRVMEGWVSLDKATRPVTGDVLYALDPYHVVFGAPGTPSPTDPGTGPNVVTTHNLLDGDVHPDTAPDGVTRGSLIYGNSTPKWDELVAPVAASLLSHDATDVAWQTKIVTRHVWIPASHWIDQGTGTLVIQVGTSPDSYNAWEFLTGATSDIGYVMQIPSDYSTGNLTFSAVWTSPSGGSGDWVPILRVHPITAGATSYVAAGTTITGAATPGNATADVEQVTTIGTHGSGLAAARRMRLVMRRNFGGSDTYTGSIRFVGLLVSYPSQY